MDDWEQGISNYDLTREILENLKDLATCVDKVGLYAGNIGDASDVVSAFRVYSDYITKLKQGQKLFDLSEKYFDIENQGSLNESIREAEENLEHNVKIILSKDTKTRFRFDVVNPKGLTQIIEDFEGRDNL